MVARDGDKKNLDCDERNLLRLFRLLDVEGKRDVLAQAGRMASGLAHSSEDEGAAADHWWLYACMPETDWLSFVQGRAAGIEEIEAVVDCGLSDDWFAELFGPTENDEAIACGLQDGLTYFAEENPDLVGWDPRLKEFPTDELEGFVREWRERVIGNLEEKERRAHEVQN